MAKNQKADTSVSIADLISKVNNFFGNPFFSKPEIFDLETAQLMPAQTDIERPAKPITASGPFRYMTVLNGQVIRPLSPEPPRIVDNEAAFHNPLRIYADFYGADKLQIQLQKIDEYSGLAIITPADADVSTIIKNSLTDSFRCGTAIGINYRGIVLQRTHFSDDLNLTPDLTLKIDRDLLYSMESRHIRASFLSLALTDKMLDAGYPKKLVPQAQATAHNLAETYCEPLNALHAYAGFTTVLFNDSALKLSIDKKEQLDAKMFDICQHID